MSISTNQTVGDNNAPDPALNRDLRTLVTFVGVYCKHKHRDLERSSVNIKGFDLAALSKRPPELCSDCAKLLTHAFVKRANCPLKPKPACKHCEEHCYHRTYRAQIQQVMRYSGRRLVLSGRLDYLYHLISK